MAVDLSVFQRQKTLLDQQQLQEAFEAKKVQQALGMKALIQQANGGIDLKSQIQLGMQQQAQADRQQNFDATMAFRAAQLGQQGAIQRETMQSRIDQQNNVRDEKRDRLMAMDQNGLNGALTGIDQQIAELEALEKNPGLAGNFGVRGFIHNLPGSDAANAATSLEKVKAGTLLSGLNNLKSQSATGASGLGSLTEREGAAVQTAQAALQKTQSYDNALKNLGAYKKQLQTSRQNLISGFNNVYKVGGQQQAAPQASQVTVSNGKETLVIDANDLQAAQKDGYRPL